MKSYVIDTNALISFVTDRDISQQEKIAEIFEDADRYRNRILCPQNVLTEFVYVMEKIYESPKTIIREIIKNFITMPGVEIVHDMDVDLLLVYWPQKVSDFGDAIVAGICRQRKGSVILTFDKKFRSSLSQLGLRFAFDD